MNKITILYQKTRIKPRINKSQRYLGKFKLFPFTFNLMSARFPFTVSRKFPNPTHFSTFPKYSSFVKIPPCGQNTDK